MGLTAHPLISEAMGNNITSVQDLVCVSLSSQAVGCWGDAGENEHTYDLWKG